MSRPSKAPVVLLFGLPSAGKTTIARALQNQIRGGTGAPAEVLDGDDLRERLPPPLSFDDNDRHNQGMRAGFIAELLSRNGITTIVAIIAPLSRTREAFGATFAERLITVWLDCEQAVRVARDSNGVYAAHAVDGDEEYVAIEGSWEPPASVTMRLDTSELSVSECVEEILAVLSDLNSR